MTDLPLEPTPLPHADWTFTMVEERLVEALLTCWRQPDRERAWSRVGGQDGPWHLIMAEAGDYDARGAHGNSSDVLIKPASLTRLELAEMEEAFGWVDHINAGERRLVAAAITQLARGRREVSWLAIARSFGLKRGSDGLRMRYGRAVASIAHRLNGGNPRARSSRV